MLNGLLQNIPGSKHTIRALSPVICCGLVPVDFIHILQDYVTGTRGIVRLSPYQRSKPEEYGPTDHMTFYSTHNIPQHHKEQKNCTYFMRYIVHFYSHFIFQPSFQWPVAPIKYHIISCLSISRIPFLFISCAKQPLPVNFADGTMLDVFYFRFITSSLWIPIGFVHHTGNKFRFTIMFWMCL